MAKHNNYAKIIPLKRKRTLIEKLSIAILIVNLIELYVILHYLVR